MEKKEDKRGMRGERETERGGERECLRCPDLTHRSVLISKLPSSVDSIFLPYKMKHFQDIKDCKSLLLNRIW